MKKTSRPHFSGSSLTSKEFDCGYCSRSVASSAGFNGGGIAFIYICPNCGRPTYFDIGDGNIKIQIPGFLPGTHVDNLPDNVDLLYREARDCASIGASTAAAMAARKILMNVAVDQGAQPNLRFIEYVNYLSDNNFIPPNGKQWVDHIRNIGNDATHEIQPVSQTEVTELIQFLQFLLTFIYSFPAKFAAPTQNS